MENTGPKKDCRDCKFGEEVCSGKFVCRDMETNMGKPLTLYDGETTPIFYKCGGYKWSKK